MVAKSLRDIREEKPVVQQQHHCCGMMMKEEKSLGYPDLDELVKNPQPLEFIIGEEIDGLSPYVIRRKLFNLWKTNGPHFRDELLEML